MAGATGGAAVRISSISVAQSSRSNTQKQSANNSTSQSPHKTDADLNEIEKRNNIRLKPGQSARIRV